MVTEVSSENLPQTGTVVVTAHVWVDLGHTVGTRDLAYVEIDRVEDPHCNHWDEAAMAPVDIPDVEPTQGKSFSVSPTAIFTNQGAGTHIYAIYGDMAIGGNISDVFNAGNIVAEFYPDG